MCVSMMKAKKYYLFCIVFGFHYLCTSIYGKSTQEKESNWLIGWVVGLVLLLALYYYLFIANYNRKPVLPGKVKYDLWQYSEKGRVRGIWTWVDLIKLASGRRVRDLEI